jgi:hypothetical protein
LIAVKYCSTKSATAGSAGLARAAAETFSGTGPEGGAGCGAAALGGAVPGGSVVAGGGVDDGVAGGAELAAEAVVGVADGDRGTAGAAAEVDGPVAADWLEVASGLPLPVPVRNVTRA